MRSLRDWPAYPVSRAIVAAGAVAAGAGAGVFLDRTVNGGDEGSSPIEATNAAEKSAKARRGPRGKRGKSGKRGLQGAAGARGIDGAAGPQGATGATGATGASGPTAGTGVLVTRFESFAGDPAYLAPGTSGVGATNESTVQMEVPPVPAAGLRMRGLAMRGQPSKAGIAHTVTLRLDETATELACSYVESPTVTSCSDSGDVLARPGSRLSLEHSGNLIPVHVTLTTEPAG